MKYIDIHCHLDFPDYGEEIFGVLDRMKENEVGAISIGTDLESSKKAIQIAEQNQNIWACVGVHPDDSPQPPLNLRGSKRGDTLDWDEVVKDFEPLSRHPKVVAIGECGLDWYRVDPADLESEKRRQTHLFEEQIELALRANKPLMLHCRQAYDDVIDVLNRYKSEAGDKLRGNSHFFAGNVDQAKKFLDLGFTLSFTGVITFARSYDEVIKFVPISKIMSETDAPFVAPVPFRGQRNEPSHVMEVVSKIAEIRGEDREQVRYTLVENARRSFGLEVL